MPNSTVQCNISKHINYFTKIEIAYPHDLTLRFLTELRPSPMYFAIFTSKIGKLYNRSEICFNVFP